MAWPYQSYMPVPMDGMAYSPQVRKEEPPTVSLDIDTTYQAGPSYPYSPQFTSSPYPYRPPLPAGEAPSYPPIYTAPPPTVYVHQGPPPHHTPAPQYRSPVVSDPAFPPQHYPLPYYSQPPQSTFSQPPYIYAPPPSAPLPPAPYSAPPYASGTISPAAIGHWQTDIRPNRSFSDLINSRESVSSEGSENGADWTPGTAPSVLNEWTPMQAALPGTTESQSIPLPSSSPLVPATSLPTGSSVGTVKASPPIGTVPLIPSGDVVPSSAIRRSLREYMSAPNRLDHGERKVIIMSPKVGQKSYGTEKRFLCPHPQAIMVGKSWWRKSVEGNTTVVRPPRVNISITGEAPVKDASVTWHDSDGVEEDEDKIAGMGHGVIHGETPFHGIAAGRSLHISDTDGKRRDVRAVVTVRAPFANTAFGESSSNGGHVLGAFDSKEIKVISKPSKKKSNAKSSELIVTHGSTIALFNRVKSQTTSTRYLAVNTDFTQYFGSDGLAASGTRPPHIASDAPQFPGLTVHASAWESFIIWLVDPMKPPSPGFAEPLYPSWPVAPSCALPFAGQPPPIRYNSTVVLQSLQTGICSPILVIRRIEHDADVVGMDGTITDPWIAVPDGELPGDLVSQLQKVAFELYDIESHAFDSRLPTTWLGCDQDQLIPKHVAGDRRWANIPTRSSTRPTSLPSTPNARFGILPMTPHSAIVGLPPTPPSPAGSVSSQADYFNIRSRNSSSSTLYSPTASSTHLPYSHEGGAARRGRTGSNGPSSPYARPGSRTSTPGGSRSANQSYEHLPATGGEMRMYWTMSIGDLCVWSVVSTEQTSYSFYIPPYVDDIQEPIAPAPIVNRVIAPGNLTGSTPVPGTSRLQNQWINQTTANLVTIHGQHLAEADNTLRYNVYYGDQLAASAEAKSAEVMMVSEPEPGPAPHEILLVRDDGRCIVPSGFIYP